MTAQGQVHLFGRDTEWIRSGIFVDYIMFEAPLPFDLATRLWGARTREAAEAIVKRNIRTV